MISKGKNIELRQRTDEDLRRELLWKKNREICYFEGLFHRGLELVEYDFSDWKEIALSDENPVFSIYRTDGLHIGTAGFFQYNKEEQTGEFGMVIGEENLWSKGYGTEASQMFLNYIFQNNITSVYSTVYSFNIRALNLALKLGFIEKKRTPLVSGKYGDYEEIILFLDKNRFYEKY